jgi:hypothetical protein
MNENRETAKKRDGVYILIILLLLGLSAALGFLIVNKNKKIAACQNDYQLALNDIQGMEEMLSGYVDTEKGDMRNELRQMLRMYDDALLKNDSNRDSIEIQKSKINELLEELDSQKKRSAREIYALRKETETLRGIMKDYVRQIDSLFTVNTGLRNELTQTSTQLSNVTSERNQLQDKASTLESQVQTGSKLSAYAITTVTLTYKTIGSGLKENNRAGKVDKIRSCFTLSENTLTKAGKKFVYMQVIGPDGRVLSSSSANVVAINGVNTLFTERKEIDYNNQSIDVCLYYDVTQAELGKGNYTVKLFCDGNQIGSDSFTLR